jgi:hypothetical protein
MPEIGPNRLSQQAGRGIPEVSVQLAKARFWASATPTLGLLWSFCTL